MPWRAEQTLPGDEAIASKSTARRGTSATVCLRSPDAGVSRNDLQTPIRLTSNTDGNR